MNDKKYKRSTLIHRFCNVCTRYRLTVTVHISFIFQSFLYNANRTMVLTGCRQTVNIKSMRDVVQESTFAICVCWLTNEIDLSGAQWQSSPSVASCKHAQSHGVGEDALYYGILLWRYATVSLFRCVQSSN